MAYENQIKCEDCGISIPFVPETIESLCDQCDLRQNEFPWNLYEGDEVVWNDPAGESQLIKIREINYYGVIGDEDCIIWIGRDDGGEVEVFAHELT